MRIASVACGIITRVAENEEGAGEEQPSLEIIVQPEHLAGVWSNFAQVHHSEHEFTLDFVRLDYSAGSPRAAASSSLA